MGLMRWKHVGIHVVRIPWVKIFWERLARTLARLGGARLAARLTLLGTDWGEPGHERPGVVCLMRDLFSKDVDQLRLRGRYNYVRVLGGISRLQTPYFPPEMQVQTVYQGYVGPARDRAVQFAQAYAREVLRLVAKRQRVDAVMSANMDYWQDLGFKLVCRELGIPFLVLMREHAVIPYALDTAITWYRDAAFRYEGAGIAVAAEHSVRMLEAVPGLVDPDAVSVTGLPRFDAWREVDTGVPMAKRNAVTLLTFTDGYYADQTFVDVLNTFVEAARTAPRAGPTRFVVKCKNYEDLYAVRSRLRTDLPPNLDLVYDEPLFTLLPRSRLVIGFNSLSLAEAALSRAPMCIPYYGECRRDAAELMFHPSDPLHTGAITFAESPAELVSCINRHAVDAPGLLAPDTGAAIARQFFHFPERGTISGLVEEFIARHANGAPPVAAPTAQG
jgi:hypothetical protein